MRRGPFRKFVSPNLHPSDIFVDGNDWNVGCLFDLEWGLFPSDRDVVSSFVAGKPTRRRKRRGHIRGDPPRIQRCLGGRIITTTAPPPPPPPNKFRADAEQGIRTPTFIRIETCIEDKIRSGILLPCRAYRGLFSLFYDHIHPTFTRRHKHKDDTD